MNRKNNISLIIEEWPSVAAFARDLGVGYEAARKMKERNRVAPEYWSNLVLICEQKGLNEVTLEWLANLRAQEIAT